MRRRNRILAYVGIVVAAAGLATLLGGPLGGLGVRQFEDFTLDLRQQTIVESFLPDVGVRESDVVLVLFDEFSVTDSIDGWDWITPFPRAHLAEVVDALSAAGARTIGLDVFLDQMYAGLNRIDGGNDLLRDAMERAGNVILATPVEQTDSGPAVMNPHPFFMDAAAGAGSAELPSSFETFREGALAVRDGRSIRPSFALALYAHARGLDADSLLQTSIDAGRLDLPGLPRQYGHIPPRWLDGTDESATAVVAFPIRFHGPPSTADAAGPPGTFQAYASSSVSLLAMLSPDFFEDKIVLMGTGFHPEDRFRTPFFSFAPDPVSGEETVEEYGWMYGVEVHANALQNMLDGSYVRPLGGGWTLLLLLLAGAITGLAAFGFGAGWGAAVTAGVLTAIWFGGFWSWAGTVYLPGSSAPDPLNAGLWVPIGTPMLAALISYVGSVAYVAIVEGREKRFIQGAFGKHLSPDRVAEIMENPAALELGGEKRPLSLLFSDLSGFTNMSEDMDAQDLIALLNEYLDEMTGVVFDEHGYLDKYIGDAIMAFWNAPRDVPDHPDRAMRTAIIMQRRMAALNDRWRADDPDRAPLKVRIGVHTGEVVVGNVGAKDRHDYSAIGDAVNLAARLEPANKTYDTLNMVSAATLAAGKGSYRVRELDYFTVAGKDEAVKVFELLEMEDVPLPEEKEEALVLYAQALEAYKARDWTGALALFEAALKVCPDDGPSRVYVTRCSEFIENPPPADWDFVVRRTEK